MDKEKTTSSSSDYKSSNEISNYNNSINQYAANPITYQPLLNTNPQYVFMSQQQNQPQMTTNDYNLQSFAYQQPQNPQYTHQIQPNQQQQFGQFPNQIYDLNYQQTQQYFLNNNLNAIPQNNYIGNQFQFQTQAQPQMTQAIYHQPQGLIQNTHTYSPQNQQSINMSQDFLGAGQQMIGQEMIGKVPHGQMQGQIGGIGAQGAMNIIYPIGMGGQEILGQVGGYQLQPGGYGWSNPPGNGQPGVGIQAQNGQWQPGVAQNLPFGNNSNSGQQKFGNVNKKNMGRGGSGNSGMNNKRGGHNSYQQNKKGMNDRGGQGFGANNKNRFNNNNSNNNRHNGNNNNIRQIDKNGQNAKPPGNNMPNYNNNHSQNKNDKKDISSQKLCAIGQTDDTLSSEIEIKRWVEARMRNFPRAQNAEDKTCKRKKDNTKHELSILEKRQRRKIVVMCEDSKVARKKQRELSFQFKGITVVRKRKTKEANYTNTQNNPTTNPENQNPENSRKVSEKIGLRKNSGNFETEDNKPTKKLKCGDIKGEQNEVDNSKGNQQEDLIKLDEFNKNKSLLKKMMAEIDNEIDETRVSNLADIENKGLNELVPAQEEPSAVKSYHDLEDCDQDEAQEDNESGEAPIEQKCKKTSFDICSNSNNNQVCDYNDNEEISHMENSKFLEEKFFSDAKSHTHSNPITANDKSIQTPKISPVKSLQGADLTNQEPLLSPILPQSQNQQPPKAIAENQEPEPIKKAKGHSKNEIIDHLKMRMKQDESSMMKFQNNKDSNRFRYQQNTLMASLLQNEIHTERNIMLRTIRHLVKNDFQQEKQETQENGGK